MSKADFMSDFRDSIGEREFNPIETMQWLKRDMSIYWSWGVSRTVNLWNKGLLLTVQGHHHKGLVLITLSWDDTYTVRFYTSRYNETKPMKQMVYCDVLASTIDRVIEKIPEYKY